MDAPPVTKDPQQVEPLPPRMSLAARLLNVFAVPGEVFLDVKTTPLTLSNWLVPALLGSIVGAFAVTLILSQPTIQQQVHDGIGKAIEELGKAWHLTPAEQTEMEKYNTPTFLKAIKAGEAALGSFLSVVWWGGVLCFLARRILKVHVSFAKALEVAGLAMMIDVLGGIVVMLLIINFGRMGATPSLALMVKDFDVTRKGHLFGYAVNVFSFWVLGVRSIGLAKLAGVSYLRAAWLVVTFWLFQQMFFIVTGLAQLAM